MIVNESFKPFLSVVILIATLFSTVFFHMEIRRVGYTVLTLGRQERDLRDENRKQLVNLARLTGPERLNRIAQSRLQLTRPNPGQVIQIADQGIAITQ